MNIPGSGNPTRHALETAIADRKTVMRGYAFASGQLAAIATVLELLDKDSHRWRSMMCMAAPYRPLEKRTPP